MPSSSLPEAGAKLTLDLSEWEADWSSAADTAEAVMGDIPTEAEVSIDITVGDDSAIADVEALDGETISPELDTTETDTSKEIRDGINFLATVEKIKIAIDIVGTALNFIKDIGSMAVNPFLDIEDAVAKINAQTGGTGIADLGQFIRDIQAADLGESVQQIGDVVIQAKQLDLPIKDATESALTFTHTWQDIDPKTVVGAWGTALQTGIVDTMQEASDLMTVFFQQGGNIGGDAIQVVQSNAQAWSDMNLNMAEALSLMDSLQTGTGATATEAAKMMLTFDDALTIAANDPTSQQAKLLAMVGIDNPKEQGKAIGADTFDGFAEGFSTLSSENQDLISGMFFGKGGKKFTGAISEMTSEGDPFKDVKDAAADAATEIDNSLRGAIDDFVLALNTKIADLLSSESIDLPGKIAAIKEGLQKGLDVLANGGTVGDALEVALDIPGLSEALDTFIGNFERLIGNIAIIFLQAVAAVQSIQGVDNKGTLAQIATLSQKQLAFDLQLANPDEVATMIDQAVQRGVTPEGIGTAMRSALDETINSGALDDALNLANAMQASADRNGNQAAQVMETWLAPFRTKVEEAVEAAKPELEQGWWNNLKPPSSFLEDALTRKQDVGAARTSGDGWWTDFQPTTDKLGDAETALEGLQTTADTVATEVVTSLETVNTAFDTTAAEAALMDQGINLSLTGNTVTASFEAVALAAETSFPAVIEWFNRTTAAAVTFDTQVSGRIQHLINLLHDLQFLSAQVATGVQQAIALGAGLGGGTTNNNTTVNVNNNVNSQAAAAANGYAIGASLRQGGV